MYRTTSTTGTMNLGDLALFTTQSLADTNASWMASSAVFFSGCLTWAALGLFAPLAFVAAAFFFAPCACLVVAATFVLAGFWPLADAPFCGAAFFVPFFFFAPVPFVSPLFAAFVFAVFAVKVV